LAAVLNGFLANRSIRFKLLFYFVFILALSLLATSLLSTRLYRSSIEEETNAHTVQTIWQVKSHIQVYLKETENIIQYLSVNDTVLDFLRIPDPNPADLLTMQTDIEKVEGVYMNGHAEISGIAVVGVSDRYALRGLERITRDPLMQESWYSAAVNDPEQLLLISHPIGRNIRAEQNLSADQVLSFVKAVKDPVSSRVIGVVLIDMKLDIIQSVVKSAPLGKSGFIYIMDRQGGIVYSPVNPIVYRISGSWLKSQEDNVITDINNESYKIIKDVFPDNGWQIVGIFPLRESLQVVTQVQTYTAVIASATLLFAFLASLYFTNSIVKPIGKLRSLMKKVEEGELVLRYQGRTNDEVGQLGNSFNNMVEELNNLIQLVYREQKEKREAELKILQAQIKPHFLYNTLDTIQWMAQDRNADDIVELINALTQLFRIGLSKGHEIIPLQEEIMHAESYLVIQMARYENKLSFQTEVPEALMRYSVLKIILQPLVENAIYHGIKPKPGSGMIRITGEIDDGKLKLVVEDDGVGIPPDKLERINGYLTHEERGGDERGYGLYNVNERIRLTHGADYGVAVESELGRGTRIIVRLPLINRREEDGSHVEVIDRGR
jgi:two-component system, sensor histidine kinase YesM